MSNELNRSSLKSESDRILRYAIIQFERVQEQRALGGLPLQTFQEWRDDLHNSNVSIDVAPELSEYKGKNTPVNSNLRRINTNSKYAYLGDIPSSSNMASNQQQPQQSFFASSHN